MTTGKGNFMDQCWTSQHGGSQTVIKNMDTLRCMCGWRKGAGRRKRQEGGRGGQNHHGSPKHGFCHLILNYEVALEVSVSQN